MAVVTDGALEAAAHGAHKVSLPKVLQQLGPPTVSDVFIICHHGKEVIHMHPLRLPGGILVTVNDATHPLHIRVVVEHDAVSQDPVPACPTCLLVKRRRQYLEEKNSYLLIMISLYAQYDSLIYY